MNRFRGLEEVGRGMYGAVYKAYDTQLKETVAVKKITHSSEREGVPQTVYREISTLQGLSHPNIIALKDVLTIQTRRETSTVLVMEFFKHDLRRYMSSVSSLSSQAVKSFLFQLLRGVSYCHSRHVIHRDLKPQNLLVDDTGNLKVADFGIAKITCINASNLWSSVVTLHYRAPELLLGSSSYSSSVDVWSVGCVFGEMVIGETMFPGNSENSQLGLIFYMIGTPTESSWRGVSKLPGYTKRKFATFPPRSLRDKLPTLCSTGIDLISRMLVANPRNRISASAALRHPYFRS